MCPESDDLKILISELRAMDIEELKANIDHLGMESNCSQQLQILNVAEKELELKYKERQEQIELLTKSLTSSSRTGRWISSFKAVIDQFVDFKN